MNHMKKTIGMVAGVSMLTASTVLAVGPSGGPYSIPWSTIDGGGVISSTGGSFTLSGTIGQPDAGGPMTGGSFSLTGGFWAGVDTSLPCPADLNGDGFLDFFDVSEFLALFAANDPIADFNPDGFFDFFDVSEFLAQFSAGCP